MGFWSGSKKAVGTVINYRVDRWVGATSIKEGAKTIAATAKLIFTPEKATTKETFDQALERLGITENDLDQRRKEFTRLFMFFLVASILLFLYSLFLLFVTKNITGFGITIALVVYTLINSFKFHFWLFQIKKRKLGCSIKEWLNS